MKPISERGMRGVDPVDGFAYFAGHRPESTLNHPTLYASVEDGASEWTVVARGVHRSFPTVQEAIAAFVAACNANGYEVQT